MELNEQELITEARAKELQSIHRRIKEIIAELDGFESENKPATDNDKLHKIYSKLVGDFFSLATNVDELREIIDNDSRTYLCAKSARNALDVSLETMEKIFEETDKNGK